MKKKRLPKWLAFILFIILIPVFVSLMGAAVNSVVKLLLGVYETAVVVGELIAYIVIGWLAVKGIMYLWNNYI
ncbi:hypothetical protein KY331_05980 [Candidatus Woesearchaeota archaeon]|nr:hypothetical protein [Candidatus Woesearchaeota archaeon]